jgi:actin-like ATPase involved in cell morphogenesis
MSYGLGIDVGTTFTAAAVLRDGQVRSVTLGQNGDAMPTTVYLNDDGEFIVGDVARRKLTENPARGAREFKRRLGDSTPLVLGGSPFSADRLMGAVIRHVVRVVTQTEGEPPAHVMVTHPSNWQAFKIDLIRQAAEAATAPARVTLIEEPVAAAVHYAHAGRIEVGELVGVYDLGGGTFDAAVLQRTNTGFRRLGQPAGIERLGGIDFDAAMMTYVQRALGDRFSALDPQDRAVRVGLEDLRAECIEAKQALSTDTTATINVRLPGLHDSVRITRNEFEYLVRPVLRETIESLRTAIANAGASADQLAAVLLIGGSSRIPLVSEVVSDEIGRPVAVDAHPKLAVAMGAAVASQAELPAAPTNADTSGRPDTAPFVVPPPEPMRTTAELSRGSREVSRPVLIAAGAVVAALVLGGAGWFAFGRGTEPEATAKPKAAERQFVEIDDIRLENGRYRVDYLVTGFVPRMGDDPDLRHIHFFLDSTDPEDAGANGEPPGEWDQTDNLSSKLTTFTPANRGTADRLCAVVVTNDHEVLDPNSGNCAALPAAPVPQRPTAPRTVRPTHSATPTSTPTVTDTPTPTVTPTAPATP